MYCLVKILGNIILKIVFCFYPAGDFSDAPEQYKTGLYVKGLNYLANNDFENSRAILEELGDFSDAKEQYKTQHSALVEKLAAKLEEILLGKKLPHPVYDTASGPESEVVLISSNRKVTKPAINKLANAHATYRIDPCEEADAIAAVMDTFEAQFQSLEQSRKESLAQLEVGGGGRQGNAQCARHYAQGGMGGRMDAR